MDNIKGRIKAFSELGSFLSQFSSEKMAQKENVLHNDLFFDGFKHQLKIAGENNTWFTNDNLLFATKSWAEALTTENLTQWTKNEQLGNNTPKNVAVIMAGNIPLVGFHQP